MRKPPALHWQKHIVIAGFFLGALVAAMALTCRQWQPARIEPEPAEGTIAPLKHDPASDRVAGGSESLGP